MCLRSNVFVCIFLPLYLGVCMCMRLSLGELEISAWLLIAQEVENIYHVILNKLTNLTFTCLGIGYYVYCNYLFYSL